MPKLSDEQIAGLLVCIISDGFNRSLGALKDAGAIDTKKLRVHYSGIGSRYYDLVTEQIELTAKHGTVALRKLLEENHTSEHTE